MRISKNVVLQFPYSETRRINDKELTLHLSTDGVDHNRIIHEDMESRRKTLLEKYRNSLCGLIHLHWSQELFGSEAWHYLLAPPLDLTANPAANYAPIYIHLDDFGMYARREILEETGRPCYYNSVMHIIPLKDFALEVKPHRKENYNPGGLVRTGENEFFQPFVGTAGVLIRKLDYNPGQLYQIPRVQH